MHRPDINIEAGSSLMPAPAHGNAVPVLGAASTARAGSVADGGSSAGASGEVDHEDGYGSGDNEGERASLMQARSSSAAAARSGARTPAPFASSSGSPSSSSSAGLASSQPATTGVYAGRGWTAWLPWTGAGQRRQAALNANLTTRQMAAFKYFRSAIVAYLTVGMMVELWSALSLVDLPWASFLMEQLLNAGMLSYLFLLFRARSNPQHGVLFDPSGYASNGANESLMGGDGYGTGTGSDAINASAFGDEEEGSEGVYGGHGRSASASSSSRVLVIQNPDVVDASGNVVPSVAIAEIVPETHAAVPMAGGPFIQPSSLGVTRAVRHSPSSSPHAQAAASAGGAMGPGPSAGTDSAARHHHSNVDDDGEDLPSTSSQLQRPGLPGAPTSLR